MKRNQDACTLSREDKQENFQYALIKALKKGMSGEVLPFGIRIYNGIDVWLIDIRQVQHEKAVVKIYHSNVLRKKRRTSLPDAHHQLTKTMDVKDIIRYIDSHENKYHKA